jgi:glycine/D-amino acid oxidase-like deaminating enzyme
MKTSAYWWEDAPRVGIAEIELPAKVDVVVIGAGFSGLCTALTLANAGTNVIVLEAGILGCGASTLNGGMVGPSFHKLGIEGLKTKYGEIAANNILRESLGFVDYLENFLDKQKIDADFTRNGRFRGALKPSHYEKMAKDLDELVQATGVEAEMIPKSQQHLESGSPMFHGGAVYHRDAGLHPAKYHDGLVKKVLEAGALIRANTRVTGIKKISVGYEISTSSGTLKATKVAVCTNGYTEKVTPEFQRRILPLRSAMIATEILDEQLLQSLMPNNRVYSDTRRVVAYYRPSPDGTRILFGSRATSLKDNPLLNARLVKSYMSVIFPQLKDVAISHVWSGLVGYTFDHAPHLGQFGDKEGLYYAMGYCGSGVARSSYFGTKLGLKMLDRPNSVTAFDELIFESAPLYNGNPWFMPTILSWQRLLDKFGL